MSRYTQNMSRTSHDLEYTASPQAAVGKENRWFKEERGDGMTKNKPTKKSKLLSLTLEC